MINKIGGTGETFIDFILITPDKIRTATYEPMNNYSGVDVQINGSGAVIFSNNEISSISPLLGKFFDGAGNVNVRNLIISGEINKFSQDFIFKQ